MPITSVFPSSTASALTTLHSGLTPLEHGLFEWTVYFKELDMILYTLPFLPPSFSEKSFRELNIDPHILFQGETLYQKLAKENVSSYALLHESYVFSEYSRLIHNGSNLIPFRTLSDLMGRLRKLVKKTKESAYILAYYDGVDTIGHRYGPYSSAHSTELSGLSSFFQAEFLDKLHRRDVADTLILVGSDHGMINISPEKTRYLQTLSKLVNNLRVNQKGDVIAPTGGPRDLFLHIQPSKRDHTYRFLNHTLSNEAMVLSAESALREGLFGKGVMNEQFRQRIGDFLVLPYDNHAFWYSHIKGERIDMRGHHGGLSKDEMLIPLAAADLSCLL
jgi:predicted AlkP superfamily pyrophosphatase or phosphodiesterase